LKQSVSFPIIYHTTVGPVLTLSTPDTDRQLTGNGPMLTSP
jgi:hypothetical protein